MTERYDGRSISWFYVKAVLYCLIQIGGLLTGFRLIPYGAVAYLIAPTLFFGTDIEGWLARFSGDQPASEADIRKRNERVWSKGFIHILPMLFAITSPVLHWTMWLAIPLLLGLVLRLGWLYTKRQPGSRLSAVS